MPRGKRSLTIGAAYGAEELWELGLLSLRDHLEHLLLLLVAVREIARQHLEEQDAEGPIVDRCVVLVLLDHLRRHVRLRPDHRPAQRACTAPTLRVSSIGVS